MLNLSINELKLLAKSSGIKGYKSISEERLLSAPSKPKLLKNNFDNERLKEIREHINKSRHKFSKLETKEIRKNLYEIEMRKKSFNTKNKRD